MKSSSWKQMALAALFVIVAGGLALAAEPQIMKVKVMKGDAEKVEVDLNGEVEVITIDDLADGEERTFEAGDHDVTVKREGDSLTVMMDGESFGTMHDHGDKKMVWVTKDADCEEEVEIITEGGMHAKKVMIVSGAGDAEGTKVIKIDCDGDDCDTMKTIDIETIIDGEIDIEALKDELGAEHVMIHVGEDGEHHGKPMIIKTGVTGHDKVVYRCTEDDAKIVLDKADATQDNYSCPICGRLMEKVEAPQMKVINVVHEIEEETED